MWTTIDKWLKTAMRLDTANSFSLDKVRPMLPAVVGICLLSLLLLLVALLPALDSFLPPGKTRGIDHFVSLLVLLLITGLDHYLSGERG